MKNLNDDSRGRTVSLLRPVLADLIALSLQAKQAHWNVRGPLFAPLHEQFDAVTDEARGWYDDVAERILALGEPADGRLPTVAKESGLEEMPAGMIPGDQAVALILDRIESVAGRLRAAFGGLEEADPVSHDMAIGIVEGLEKRAWMLRVQAG